MKIFCRLCNEMKEFRESLSKKQIRVLKFIIDFKAEHGQIPTIREMKEGLNYKSNSIVHHHIDILVYKQYLARKPYCARSLVILKEIL